MSRKGRRNLRPGRKSNPQAKSRQPGRHAVIEAGPAEIAYIIGRYQAARATGGNPFPDLPGETRRVNLDPAALRVEMGWSPDLPAVDRMAIEGQAQGIVEAEAARIFRMRGTDLVTMMLNDRRLDATTSAALPLSPAAVLYGRGVLTPEAYAAAVYYGAILELWHRGAGIGDASCEAIYRRMIAGSVDDATAGRYSDANVDHPTTGDRAKSEVLRYEELLTERQRGLARGIADGEWLGPVMAAVAGGARFRPPVGAPLVLIEGHVERRHLRALGEIAEAFMVIAEVPPRLRSATLAA